MSRIAQYVSLEQQLKSLQEELEQFQNSEEFQQELAFKSALEKVCSDFGKSHEEAITALGGQAAAEPQQDDGRSRKKRKLKTYRNPHTGEIVQTRGGNQRQLKSWRDEHGAETVDSWITSEE